MPHWFLVAFIVFLVAPGAAIILFGVYAFFRASGPGAPLPGSGSAPTDTEPPPPHRPNFGEAPVTEFPTLPPAIVTQPDDVIEVDVAAIESEVNAATLDVADPTPDLLLPPPEGA